MARYQDVLARQKVVITYDPEAKLFTAVDQDGSHVASGPSGKALGKKAWDEGASKVVYDYDLGLDE